MTLQVALVGCGSIGRYVLEAVQTGRAGDARVQWLISRPESGAWLKELAERWECRSSTEMPAAWPDVDLIVEAAGVKVVRSQLIPWLDKGKDVLVMSLGALADPVFFEEAAAAARRTGRRVHLPSGAVGGLDALRSAALAGLDSVVLTTRKPPAALTDAPFVREQGIDLDRLAGPTEIFAGNAAEAAAAFPANLNVAMAVSLAALGPERTQVHVVADPGLTCNVHEIMASGPAGSMQLRFENRPSPHNPKTSYLAALSAVSTLRGLTAPLPGIA